MVRMTPAQLQAERDAMDTRARASERMAELEKRIADSDTEAIGWIEAQQAVNGAMRGDIIWLMEHCTELQGEVTGLGEAYNAQAEELDAQARKLEASQEQNIVFIGLVERMGRDLDIHYAAHAHGEGSLDGYYPYTLVGQREYDAAMHKESE